MTVTADPRVAIPARPASGLSTMLGIQLRTGWKPIAIGIRTSSSQPEVGLRVDFQVADQAKRDTPSRPPTNPKVKMSKRKALPDFSERASETPPDTSLTCELKA